MLLNRFGVTVVFSVLALTVGCGGSDKKVNSAADVKGGGSGDAEVGKPAPDLSIQTLNGKGKISLESLSGKIVVVDFWATWCGPCKESFPKLEALSKRVGDKVEVLGVSVDEEKSGVAEFAKEQGATFAIGWDEGHTHAKHWMETADGPRPMPTTFILDGSGKIRYIHKGYHDGETDKMAKELAALVDEAPASGGTRVAKNDKGEKSDSASKSDSKDDSKSEKSDKTEAASTSSSGSTASDDGDDPPPPPKKKAGKGKGKAGGKKATKKKK